MATRTLRRFTVGEYERMVDVGILTEEDRVELVGGEIVDISPIGSRHAAQVRLLAGVLQRVAGDRAIVSIQAPIRLDDASEPQPDLALLRPRGDFYATGHPGSEDVRLVVEVADTSVEFERNVKVPLYARAGIPLIWLIDVSGPGVIEVYEGRDMRPSRAGRGRRLALPWTELPVNDILLP